MTRRENDRASILMAAQQKGRTNREIADAMGLSIRQVQRLKRELEKSGPSGVAHGNRGCRACNATPSEVEDEITRLYAEKYKGFNFTHYTEKLNDEEEIIIGVSTVRRILNASGHTSPKKRRQSKHRSRRERKSHEGAMLQLDGSIHDWLEGRGPKLCLVGAIDDATGMVPGALFREREDSHGYFLLMREIAQKHGIPETVYRDRHSVFETNSSDNQDAWDRLTNKPALTQFGRLLDELGVRDIPANSPQAKGRVERLWGTFQDRLVSELRLAKACTMDEADAVLKKMIAEHNRRFAKEAKESGSVYRKLDKTCDRDRLFCFKYRRTVAKDNAVRFADTIIDIPKGPGGRSYAGCRVELIHRFDNSLWLYYQGQCISKTQPDPTPPARIRVRTSNGRYTEECPWADIESWQPKPKKEQELQTTEPRERRSSKPAANHPWRRPWVT